MKRQTSSVGHGGVHVGVHGAGSCAPTEPGAERARPRSLSLPVCARVRAMSSFNPRNHGTLSFVRKERPCLSSSFVDVNPSRAALVRAELQGTMSNRVSWEVRSGRFALDAKLNKPPPRTTQRVWTSPHCPRAAPEHVNSLSQDHPRFPYHARTGRYTDPGSAADTIQAGPRHFIAERTTGTAELGKPGTHHATPAICTDLHS